jgi:hypothetical protein
VNLASWVALGVGVLVIVAAMAHVLRARVCAFCGGPLRGVTRWVGTCDGCSGSLRLLDAREAEREDAAQEGCPACRAYVGATADECPWCGEDLHALGRGSARRAAGLGPVHLKETSDPGVFRVASEVVSTPEFVDGQRMIDDAMGFANAQIVGFLETGVAVVATEQPGVFRVAWRPMCDRCGLPKGDGQPAQRRAWCECDAPAVTSKPEDVA